MTITTAQLQEALDVLSGKSRAKEGAGRKTPADKLLSREEVAALINRSVQTVDYYCRHGIFRRVRLGASSRSSGISAASVEAWLGEEPPTPEPRQGAL